MNKFLYPSVTFLFLFFCLSIMTFNTINAQNLKPFLSHQKQEGSCITSSKTTPEQMATIQSRYEDIRNNMESIRKSSNNTPIVIPVQIHIVTQNDGTGGADLSIIKQEFENNVMPIYAQANIFFSLCAEPNILRDSDFYILRGDDPIQPADVMAARHNVPNVLNIYYAVVEKGNCGFAKIPGIDNRLEDDYIVMHIPCANNGVTTAHELGHFFGLFHTFETFFGMECPDGRNCSNTGDLICDTPADPNLTNKVDQNCNYIGNDIRCGQRFNPDTRNIMSYAPFGCRNRFSNQQLGVIFNISRQQRKYLISPICQAPKISFADYLIDDDNRTSKGNNNGRVEPGEKIELKLKLRNHGARRATGVTAILSTNDPHITNIMDNKENFPNIDPITAAISTADFDFEVDPNSPEKWVLFFLDITSDQGNWRDYFWVYLFGNSTTPPSGSDKPNLTSCGDQGNNMSINGSSLSITAVVKNSGGVKANSSRVGYFLSKDNRIDNNDILIGDDYVRSLDPGETSIETITVDLNTINAPSGTYFVMYLLDYEGKIAESDEQDNGCYWDNPTVKLPLTSGKPNLVSCSNSGNRLNVSSSSISITVIVTNSGGAKANSSRVGYYLSKNNILDGSDYLIGDDYVRSLDPGKSSTETITVDFDDLNVPSGSYYVMWAVDYQSDVSESKENDNICYWSSPKVNISAGMPDLTSCGDSNTKIRRSSSTYNLTVRVRNSGSAKARSSYVGYYLLSDGYLSTGNGPTYYLGEDYVRSLDPGSYSTETFSFNANSLNVIRDIYYVSHFLDYKNQVAERDENNGCYWPDEPINFFSGYGAPLNGDGTIISNGIELGIELPTNARDLLIVEDLPKGKEISLSTFPNPAKDQTSIQFELPVAGEVSLTVQDLQGRVVTTLLDRVQQTAGNHRIDFNTSELKPGVYICTLRTANTQKAFKLIITQ